MTKTSSNPHNHAAGVEDRPQRLSAYAFSDYGADAKLYNGILDLEREVAILRQQLAEVKARRASLLAMIERELRR